MKTHPFEGVLVSDKVWRTQAVGRSRACRAAAGFLLASALVLLVGLAIGYELTSRLDQAKGAERNAEDEKSRLEARVKPLAQVKAQLAEIRRWEVIMSRRLPMSGVLSAIEAGISRDLCLRLVSIEGRNHDRAGDYRLPTTFELRIEGVQAKGDKLEIGSFANSLLSALPTGSQLISIEHRGELNPATFTVVMSITLGGDWSKMGLTRIPIYTR